MIFSLLELNEHRDNSPNVTLSCSDKSTKKKFMSRVLPIKKNQSEKQLDYAVMSNNDERNNIESPFVFLTVKCVLKR